VSAPAIGVLLPLRDAARDLVPCLRSLRRQSLASFEVVAIDDGSTDETAEIFRRETAADRRFRLVPASGRGLVSALGQAAAETSAPWLARMDGDDVCHARRFELQLALASAAPETCIVSSLVRIAPRPPLPGMARYERWINALRTHEQMLEQLFVESPLAHPSVLMRRDAFDAAGGYRARPWPEDYDLWLRLAAAGGRFAKVPRVLLWWRDRPDRASRTLPEYSAAAFRACKLEHLRRAYPLERGCVILGAGPTGRPWARLLQAEGVEVRAFVDINPRRLGRTIAGVPVVGYDALCRLGPAVLLSAVGREGGREQVLEWFRQNPPAAGQRLVLVA
jgi:GT2 family glycosyltransferase